MNIQNNSITTNQITKLISKYLPSVNILKTGLTPIQLLTKREPQCYIKTFEFDSVSRVASIEIIQSQEYRTVERYRQINYEKYPEYSEWKIKKKSIYKTIKLSNEVLEGLNQNEDELIRLFAYRIVLQLNDHKFYPSWFIKFYLQCEFSEKIAIVNEKQKQEENTIDNKIHQINKVKEAAKTLIVKLNDELENKKKYIVKLNKKINKNESKLVFILKSVFSLGIYAIINSDNNKKKISQTIVNTQNEMLAIVSQIEENTESNKQADATVLHLLTQKQNILNEACKSKKLINNEYFQKMASVKTMQKELSSEECFFMLKNLSAFHYENIKGCYVIRNRENGKCYVGQSKDVYKRLKDHFRGTVPLNHIFFDDYYNSKLINKEELFEIKIYKCQTKDELDNLERKLIVEYDAKNRGYNRTKGNC